MCKKGVPTKLKLFHETYLINLNPEENRIEEMEEIKEIPREERKSSFKKAQTLNPGIEILPAQKHSTQNFEQD